MKKTSTIIFQQQRLSCSAPPKQQQDFVIYARRILVSREGSLRFHGQKNSIYDTTNLLFSFQEITFTAVSI